MLNNFVNGGMAQGTWLLGFELEAQGRISLSAKPGLRSQASAFGADQARESDLAAPGSVHLRSLADQIQQLDGAVPCYGALATKR